MDDEFGDFDEDDAYDDGLDLVPNVYWDDIFELQRRYDEITVLSNPEERKIAAKLLVQELNGEPRGTVLAT